jgi:hypothetical protein
VATCLVFVLGPAPAAPAAIFDLTADQRAEHPDIAIDDNGTAHIAWNLSSGIPGDDTLVYCRVPAGAHACDVTHTISLPRTDFNGPRVVLGNSGEIVLLSGRCCFPASPVYAVTSSDGGQSFGPPVTIASEFAPGSEWDAEFGPGDFSVALSGGNSGPDFAAIWRAAPLDGSDPDSKVELAPFPKAYFNSTGFPAPTSPIAVYTDLNDIFLRRWNGSGAYNDSANWTPEEQVAHGTEPKLASGARGVYLIYRGSNPPYQYFVRRFDGQNFPEDPGKTVSDPGTGQSARFRDFFQDDNGNLHGVFLQGSKTGEQGLRHRVSEDGDKTWEPVETLTSGPAADDLFNLRVGAGDGWGAVVGDHNGAGPVWFAPFKVSAGGGKCKSKVKLGKAIARALTGCFKHKGNDWVATGPVKLNGVDIEPLGGSARASASAAFHVTAAPGPRTLTSSAKANVRVGEAVLERGPVEWKLPPGDGKVVRLNSPDGSVFSDLGKFTKKLFEFPIDGDAELVIAGTGAKIPTHFRMPPLLGGVTGDTTLRTNQNGQVTKGMTIDVHVAAIGLLHIADVNVTYDNENRFTGTAKIELPPVYSGLIPKSSVTFAFEDGELSVLKVEPPEFKPALPIVGVAPTPIVGLERVAFSYVRKPDSRLFEGDVFLLGGPNLVDDLRAATLDGAVTLEFPATKPTTVSATGKLSVVKIPFASGWATYTVPSTFDFGGSFELLGFQVASVKGFVDLVKKAFSASGEAKLGPLGSGEAVLSNDGASVCVHFPDPPGPVPAPPPQGFTWKWGDLGPTGGCAGFSPFARSSVAHASRAGVSFPAGLKEGLIAVEGAGAAPDIVVNGPNGERVAGGTTATGANRFRITSVQSASRTYVQIESPGSGAYQVEAQPGSVPIATVSTAGSLPEPRVKASVKGKGTSRSLRFRLRRIAGQRVTFAEQAKRVYREIGTTGKAHGVLHFHLAQGPGGRRDIVAIVEQNGVPRAKLTVAHYKAPPTRRLRRPRHVVARRSGSRLMVGWSAVRGARGYEVHVNLPRDGRRLLFFPPPKKHRLKVKGIEPSDLARVTVAAIGPDLRSGREAKAKLRPKKQSRKRRHGGRRR